MNCGCESGLSILKWVARFETGQVTNWVVTYNSCQ